MYYAEESSGEASQQVQRWCSPTDEFLKVNIDVAFLMDHKSGRWGFIVRDVDRNVVMARVGRDQHQCMILFVQRGSGLPAALTAISTQGMTRIQLGSDSPTDWYVA